MSMYEFDTVTDSFNERELRFRTKYGAAIVAVQRRVRGLPVELHVYN